MQVALPPDQRRQWARAHAALLYLLLIVPILLCLMARFTDWDLALADAAFDVRLHAFPWRHAWLAEVFNHVMLKALFGAFGLAIMLLALWDLGAPLGWSGWRRYQLRVVALSAVLVPALTSVLKQLSTTHCPWDLARYGGAAPYVRLFEQLPAGITPGQCMPAGHASSALWMVSLAIVFVPGRIRHAAATLAIALAIGVAMGWMQQLRGAHFLSHTLWSCWVAVATVYGVATCLALGRRGALSLAPYRGIAHTPGRAALSNSAPR